MHLNRSLLLAGAIAVAGCASPRAAPVPVPEARVDSALAVATFDTVWSRIANTHYDTAFNGVDWDAVRIELRPRAAAARTLPELRTLLSEMLARLGESHFGIIPGETAGALDDGATAADAISGDVGAELRLVDGRVLVAQVEPGGAADRAGVKPGWAVSAIDNADLATRVAAFHELPEERRRVALTSLLYQLNGRLGGATGSTVTLHLTDGNGARHVLTLVREPIDGMVVKLGNLPPQIASLSHERIELPQGGCAGLIRFNVWMVPLAAAFERAMDELASCDGVIIDLRGNPGGVAGLVMGFSGYFLNDTIPLGFMKLRTGEARFKANPRRVRSDGTRVEPYDGALAILTDQMSASTSEFFAAGLQAIGRARVFGATSAGQALPAVLVQLPTGDVLMHVLADFTGPGGIRIEGVGVVPDVPVELRRDLLLQGRDAALDAALLWIRNGSTPRTQDQGASP